LFTEKQTLGFGPENFESRLHDLRSA